MTIKRTISSNDDFIQLVKDLDSDLAIRDGADHAFYDQFNKIDKIKHVVVAYDDLMPIGCGAFKPLDRQTVEIKRMYTSPKHRGTGIATLVLTELEQRAAELGHQSCVLETGIKQPEAIALYQKNGYSIIANYGQYENVETSKCFKKELSPQKSI